MATLHGGEKLKAKLAEMARLVSAPATLRVGFLENSYYPDGTSVPMVAATNEYGKKNQPARPYFRNMIAAKSPEWPGAMAGLLAQTGFDAEQTLLLTGEIIVVQLKDSIEALTSPPLAPSTVARKGFDKPLIESALMRDTAAYEVNT